MRDREVLIDLISTSNYVSFNIKLASVIGLKEAIYVSELMNINEKAIRKGKTDDFGFVLCREYMHNRTTIDEDEQLEIEEKLRKIGIIDKQDADGTNIILHLDNLTTILMSPDEGLIGDIKTIVNNSKKSRKTKKEAIVENLKKSITETNSELVEAYSDWIEAVCSRQGWMSKQSVIEGQKLVNSYANHNLDTALGVVRVAAINGYRDISWAIDRYEKQPSYGHKSISSTKRQGLSEEVF